MLCLAVTAIRRNLWCLLLFLFNPGIIFCQDEFLIKRTEKWHFDHYQPAEGKIIGIWPHHARIDDPFKTSELHQRFGFNYILIPAVLDTVHFNRIIAAGFPQKRIMAQILVNNYLDDIKSFGTIYAYYLDEPAEHGFSVEGIREAIDTYAPGSLFIISGYRRISFQKELADKSDGIMFSSYKHWWQCFPGVWCAWPFNDDQRTDWTDMKNRYGNKSFMNWVGAHRDLEEYTELLEHSAKLNLPGVWLYQYQETLNSDDNILNFCYNAWAEGYLRRFEKKYIYEYRCTNCRDGEQGDWFLYNVFPGNEVIEVFYDRQRQ